jgi:nucleotide-binding universal stress UspA family protein
VKDDIPHRAILAAVGRLGCDLIVMASHGRRGMEGLLLGSETQRVLLRSTVPVLVVR